MREAIYIYIGRTVSAGPAFRVPRRFAMPSTVTCLFGRKKSGGSGAEEDKRTLMRTDCSCDSGLNVRGGSDLTLDVRCCGGDGVWGGRKRGLGEGYDNWSCSASVQALAESAPPAVVAVRQPEIPPSTLLFFPLASLVNVT